MVHRCLIAAALSFCALSAHAAVVVPPQAVAALQSGESIDLIVEFASAGIDRAARARRRPGAIRDPRDTRDTSAVSAFRVQRYRQAKDLVDSELAAAVSETRLDFTHLPMRLQRFESLAALEAWAANAQVAGLHVNSVFYPALTRSLPLIGEPSVAAAGYAGAGTTVAVIDGGIDYTNAAFGPCTAVGVPASCRVARSLLVGGATGSSSHGHGTAVAAIVAAVAPGARIVMLDAYSGNGAAMSDVIAGIDWAIANQATYNIASINLSLSDGARNTAPCASGPVVTAVARANAAGITVVAASGNNAYANALVSPACASGVVSVGAVYSADFGSLDWPGSNCTDAASAADRVACFANSASFLTLLAPGALITAGGMQLGGTSFSSPHVAGAVAVLRAAFPDESLAATLARLTRKGVPVTDARNGLVTPRIDLLASSRPANDGFSARVALTGSSGSASGGNRLATREAGESALSSGAAGHTVWWRWVAPATGPVALDTHGSAIDTVLAVYPAGSGAATLVPLAINDDDGGAGGASGLQFMASAGADYAIAIDGMSGAQGALALNWSLDAPVANLSVTLTGPPTGTLGVATQYALTVANAGPQVATHVKVALTLPAGASLLSSPTGCVQTETTLVCAVDKLASGASMALAIVLEWTTAGSRTLAASVSSDLADPIATDNGSVLAVTETEPAPLPEPDPPPPPEPEHIVDGDVPTLPQWASIVLAGLLLGISALKGKGAG